MASVTTNSSYDPSSQNVTIYATDGTPVTFTLHDIDFSFWYNSAASINFGAQFGACAVMFFVVFILTNSGKRTKPIFILNVASLFLGAVRSLTLSLFFVSKWVEVYPTFTGDYSALPPRAYALSIAATVMASIFTLTVDTSLVLQAHVVAKSMNNLQRHIITGLGCIFLFVSVGFRFALMVINSLTILRHENFLRFQWLTKCSLISQTATIWYFSLIFTGKLVYTLYTRRRNGWKQWSGMRILAAMGGCTMIIPSLFAILEYVQQNAFPEGGTIAMTFVALLLPLSSLWAGMAINTETSTLNKANLTHIDTKSDRSSDTDYKSRKTCTSQFSESTAAPSYSTERKGSTAPISPTTIDSRIETQGQQQQQSKRDSTEADLEAMGVRIDRSYSIHSGRE